MSVTDKPRCSWCTSDKEYIHYHDHEWGLPVYDERKLFEMITLEGAQAGLSWLTILKRRDGYRKAFSEFDPAKVARFTPAKVRKLMLNEGIIRNRLKIESTVSNARAFMETATEFGSFSRYIWQFTDGKVIHNKWKNISSIPATTMESDAMSKDLKKRGFRFTGSTICYAFMQAVGMVNDHTMDCFRYNQVKNMKPRKFN